MSNNKQSSVDFLWSLIPTDVQNMIDKQYDGSEQAKAMHKEEIINIVVWCDDTDRIPQQIKIEAEQYYNETYGGNNDE